MSRWFRVYDDAVNDPKVQRLAPHLFKAWFNILCLANKSGNGLLPSVSDIAFALRMSDTDAQSAVDELILVGLIDIAANKTLTPHNWESRQAPSDNSKERTRKWREGRKSSDGVVTVGDGHGDGLDQTRQASDSEPDQSASAEKKQGSFDLGSLIGGFGLGGDAARTISTEMKRKVCQEQGLSDCEPLVDAFWIWDNKKTRDHRARKPDLVFKSAATKLLNGLDAAERDRITIKPVVPEKPPARASSQLVASLGGTRGR